jgi:GDPmannose 4,6-dehydratase
MLVLLDQEKVFEVVMGSGEGHSVEEWLERCFSAVGRRWRDHVTVKPGFRAEYPRLVSRPEVLKSLGWRPRVTFDALAAMMTAAT